MKLETFFSGIKPNPTQWLDDFRNRFFPKAHHLDIKLPQKLFLAGRKNKRHMLELWSRHRCRTHAANIRRVPALCKLRKMFYSLVLPRWPRRGCSLSICSKSTQSPTGSSPASSRSTLCDSAIKAIVAKIGCGI